jgi:hypothetical protein
MIHFHDLRNTGNQLAAGARANLRELMDRMGHSTTRAAMAYLHGSDERKRAIADELSRQAAAALKRPNRGRTCAAAGEGIMSLAVSLVVHMLTWGFASAFGRIRTPRPAA